MTTSDIVNFSSVIIQTATLVIGAITIYTQLKKAGEDRENGTYDSLDERFTRFLEVCSEHADLEVYNPSRDNWKELGETKYRQQLILFQILVSIFERAYILYNIGNAKKSINRIHQWAGWVQYMRDYANSPTFQYAWHVEQIGRDMDSSFVSFMEKTVKVKEYNNASN